MELSKEARNKMEQALSSYKNGNGLHYWWDMYNNAPSDNLKEYINTSFCCHIDGLFDDEICAWRNELRNKLNIRDYEYLKRYSYGTMRNRYQAKINELKQKK